MTVTYTAEVATCRGLGCFPKLLARWRGSIYKLIWMDLFAFLVFYYVLRALYYYVLNPDQKKLFEGIVEYCNWHGDLIPVSFVLGFYVTIVMKRWWDQYLYIAWPDSIAVYISAHVHGNDERGRVTRRTVMRYVCLCQAIVLAYMSPHIKKRFSTWDHFVSAGLLQESEKRIFQKLEQKFPAYPLHWMPIVWSASIIVRARKEGRIRDDCAVKTIVDELNLYRGKCGLLLYYDFISVPLVYTQVVTLAVYSYFLGSLMGKQIIDNTSNPTYFPIFSTLEFFFYMGWLKVAEVLINPFGDDDDDFEVNWLIDRHMQVSYMIVDEMHQEHPELVRDQYWDEVFPLELPYANEGGAKREEPPESSTAKIGLTNISSDIMRRSTVSTFEPGNLGNTFGRMSVIGFDSKSGSWSSSEASTKKEAVALRTPKKGIRLQSDLSDFERLRQQRMQERILRRTQSLAIPRETSPFNLTRATRTSYFLPVPNIEKSDSELSTPGRKKKSRVAPQDIKDAQEDVIAVPLAPPSVPPQSSSEAAAPLAAPGNLVDTVGRASAISFHSKSGSWASSEGSSEKNAALRASKKAARLQSDNLSDFERLRQERLNQRILRRTQSMAVPTETSRFSHTRATRTSYLLPVRNIETSDSELLTPVRKKGSRAAPQEIEEDVNEDVAAVAPLSVPSSADTAAPSASPSRQTFHSLYSYHSISEARNTKRKEEKQRDQEE